MAKGDLMMITILEEKVSKLERLLWQKVISPDCMYVLTAGTELVCDHSGNEGECFCNDEGVWPRCRLADCPLMDV